MENSCLAKWELTLTNGMWLYVYNKRTCPENKTTLTSKVRDDGKTSFGKLLSCIFSNSLDKTRALTDLITSDQFKESTSEIRGVFTG